ncbi:FecR family protein [Altericroceibacterium spongiae]|nr:FecR domain-containing protein [Altericroceibacterium spongiae]
MNEAAEWYARLNAPDCSESDRRDFSAWLKADIRHESAWSLIASADSAMDQAADHPMIAELIQEARSMPPVGQENAASSVRTQTDGETRHAASHRRLAPWHYGIAAALALTVGLGGLAAWHSSPLSSGEDARLAQSTHYATGVGEKRVVTLADGSTLTLDTNSAVEIPQWGERRLVHLVKGQAFFEVAKDAEHPFIVESGGNSVEALGTAFTVREGKGTYNVALLKGRVKVALGLAGAGDAILEPGDTLSLYGKTVAIRHKNAARFSGWLEGRLTFEQRPLGSIVAEMNRYSTRKIVLADSELQNRPFSGTFTTDGGDALVSALGAYGIAHVLRSDDKEVVLAAS